ncbi:MAG: hypothetical protein J6V64_02405 [Burkholderiaceae bacterium]|nr:hypothetical protein [Burkholderiaceae bacterium]
MTKLDNQTAEDVGLAFAGCLRDQIRFTVNEAARATNVSLPIFAFINPGPVREFKAIWSAFSQGIAIWAILEKDPELRENEKALRKIVHNMQTASEKILAPKVFQHMSNDQWDRYNTAKRDFLRLAQETTTMKYDFADAFLRFYHGEGSKKINDRVRQNTVRQVELVSGVFLRLYEVVASHPVAAKVAQ